jgi:hypothetical protein
VGGGLGDIYNVITVPLTLCADPRTRRYASKPQRPSIYARYESAHQEKKAPGQQIGFEFHLPHALLFQSYQEEITLSPERLLTVESLAGDSGLECSSNLVRRLTGKGGVCPRITKLLRKPRKRVCAVFGPKTCMNIEFQGHSHPGPSFGEGGTRKGSKYGVYTVHPICSYDRDRCMIRASDD